MNRVRPVVILITLITLVVGFILSVLTNYASASVPEFIKHHPIVLWIGIILCILILLSLGISQLTMKDKRISPPPLNTNMKKQNSLTAHQYDVFISYNHTDAEWVTDKLLSSLEQRGFTVFIDFRDFRTGSSSIEEMERGVLESKRVIIVMTRNYMNSQWTKFENIMSQTLDPGAIQRKIIPILREDCDIPLRLQILHYRDLRNDDSQEWERLFRDLM